MYAVTVIVVPHPGAAVPARAALPGLRDALLRMATGAAGGLEHLTVGRATEGLALTCFVGAADPGAAAELADRLCRSWTVTGPLVGWRVRSSRDGPH